MAIDLQPLTSEMIHKMGYSTHDLWVIKIHEDMYGPFEVESLKQFAAQNAHEFQDAMASRMDTNDWKPFDSHAQFQEFTHHSQTAPEVVEKYWVVFQGQKTGPLSRIDIDKKLELSILNLGDLVSTDDGLSWAKFYSLSSFNQHAQSSEAPPMAPLDSSFLRAKEELYDWMETHESIDPASSLAALTYLAQHKDKNKVSLNLNEIDLKTLGQTEVSRSLKWVVPSAVAGVSLLAMVGNFLMSPSSSPSELASVDETRVEKILPAGAQRIVPVVNEGRRTPASYRPPIQHSPAAIERPYVQPEYPSQVETHFNEPDPMIDPRNEDASYLAPEPQEPSLVSNTLPGNGSLDDMMNGASDERYPPEQPVIEESNDF